MYRKAVSGVPGAKPIRELADEYAEQYPGDTEAAAKALAHNQILKCGTTGFFTSLGGVITLPVAISADVLGVLFMQIRMIGAIAILGGLDENSDQAQPLVLSCLAKEAIADACREAGFKVGQQIAINAIKNIPGQVIAKINQRVGFQLVSRFGYSKLGANAIIKLGQVAPFVGGFFAGGIDAIFTKAVANRAITLFIRRRVPVA